MPPVENLKPKIALTYAGFDPSAGAGYLADLKVFAKLGLWGMALCSAHTIQNSAQVFQVIPTDATLIKKQFDALNTDFDISGVKIGMLGDLAHVKMAQEILSTFKGPKILDPIFISSSGQNLLPQSVWQTMQDELLPMVDLVTPNLSEAQQLTKMPLSNIREMGEAARYIQENLKVPRVLIKGGHLEGPPTDVYLGPEGYEEINGTRIDSLDPHGTGCLLSSAILAYKILGVPFPLAIIKAKKFTATAISQSCQLGAGKPYWNL